MNIRSSRYLRPANAHTACADRCALGKGRGELVAVLADGVSSSKGGAEAAQRATRYLSDCFNSRPSAWSPTRALMQFGQLVNHSLYHEGLSRADASGLLSTLSAVILSEGSLYGMNIGDSPVFLLRSGNPLRRLTEEHNRSKQGEPMMLTKALGAQPDFDPFLFQEPVQVGDIILLCSDGLTDCCTLETLATFFKSGVNARELVEAVLTTSRVVPRDDISAILLEVCEPENGLSFRPQERTVPDALHAGDLVDGHKLIRSMQSNQRVWLAQDESSSNRVVLKFPPLEARSEPERLSQFLEEVCHATRLRSQLLVPATVPEQSALHYYVQPYVEAPSLKLFLTTRLLAVEEALRLAYFLLDAGQFLAGENLLHGDIKPENILVLRDRDQLDFKLLDLGCAHASYTVPSKGATPSYLAPERFHNAPSTESSELFSIGATLYRALTGKLPYGEIEPFQKPRFTPCPAPSALNSAVPAWLDSVILRACAITPAERYGCFSEMRMDLEHPTQVKPIYSAHRPLLDRLPLRFLENALRVAVSQHSDSPFFTPHSTLIFCS